jgi:hypothetical protein
MQWSPKENQPLWPQALPMRLNLLPDQPYRLTSPCPTSSTPSLISRMTSPTSCRSPSNKAPKSKNKITGSKSYHPYVNSSKRRNWTTELALGPYTTISFPSRREKNLQEKEESHLDKPIGTSSQKKTLFERMKNPTLNPNQRMTISESETSFPGASTPPAHPKKRSLRQHLQSPTPRLQPQQLPCKVTGTSGMGIVRARRHT